MFKPKDITGMRSGRLVAITLTPGRKNRSAVWLCECDCGGTKEVSSKDFVQKTVTSCGCLAKQKRAYIPFYYHNREYESPLHEYRVAHGMTVGELAKACSTSQNEISGLANGMHSPVYKHTGEMKTFVKKMCKIFNVEFYQLFPRYECKLPGYHNNLTDDQIYDMSISQPDLNYEKARFWEALCNTFEPTKKTKYQLNILYLHKIKGLNLSEIGRMLGISREYARQVFKEIFNRLKHPERLKKLYHFKEVLYNI